MKRLKISHKPILKVSLLEKGMGEALLSGLRFAWWLSSDLLWWTVNNRCRGFCMVFVAATPRSRIRDMKHELTELTSAKICEEKIKETIEAFFMVLFLNRRLDLTVEQLLSNYL